jgi:hypothetical protein
MHSHHEQSPFRSPPPPNANACVVDVHYSHWHQQYRPFPPKTHNHPPPMDVMLATAKSSKGFTVCKGVTDWAAASTASATDSSAPQPWACTEN